MGRFLDRLDRFKWWRLVSASADVDVSVRELSHVEASGWLHEPYGVLWTAYGSGAFDIAVKRFCGPEYAATIIEGPIDENAFGLKPGDELLLAHHWIEDAGTSQEVNRYFWLLVQVAK